MKKLLIHLGMGGHTSQILRLVNLLGPNYRYEYLIGYDDQTSAKKIKFPGKIYRIKNPRLMKDKSLLKVFFNMFPATIQAFKILRKSRPSAVISAGPSQTIPLFWLAKLMGILKIRRIFGMPETEKSPSIKTIYLESWVRVHHKSKTGKLVYPISDLFFVQWKTMKKVYPKAVYAGRLS